jgi:hypothetical protein
MTDARTALIEALANDVGVAPLSGAEVDAVLELAAVAAHGSGDRTSAPLATFLAGIAAAGADERAAVVAALKERTSQLTETVEG